MKENIFYSPKYDVVIITGSKDGKTRCLDIFGKVDTALCDILGEISSGAEDEILLGFTPLNAADFICQKHFEENTTLFVNCDGNYLFGSGKLMFPIISHA